MSSVSPSENFLNQVLPKKTARKKCMKMLIEHSFSTAQSLDNPHQYITMAIMQLPVVAELQTGNNMTPK